MTIQTIGVLSPGSMGQAIGQQLIGAGFTIYTSLDGRSDRTRRLAEHAGFLDAGSLSALVEKCDVILSVLNPAAAHEVAESVARAVATTGSKPLFVDCNAIAPGSMHSIAQIILSVGGRCVDGAVMSAPPRDGVKGRLIVSGPDAHELKALATPEFSVSVVGARVGDASAIKMCDAVMTKGVTALVLEMMIAARRLGILEELETQFHPDRRAICRAVMNLVPTMPSKSYRWVPEVGEIASTLESAGMPPTMMSAAADFYSFVAATPLGQETPESRDRSRTAEDVVRILADGPR